MCLTYSTFIQLPTQALPSRAKLCLKYDLAVDLMLLRIPRAETLERVGATLFPDADHIMLLTISPIIKLPEVVVQDHFAQMSNLPLFLIC